MSADRFKNFAALAKEMKEGTDYKVSVRESQSDVTVLAPHGGEIETHTGALATALADTQGWNLYLFEGYGTKPEDLHITSSRFDEPKAVTLVAKSRGCVSIHGFKQGEGNEVCVGGLDQRRADLLASKLRASLPGVKISYPCARFRGLHTRNIVNRCGERGVQLELSMGVRKLLIADSKIQQKFIADIADVYKPATPPDSTLAVDEKK